MRVSLQAGDEPDGSDARQEAVSGRFGRIKVESPLILIEGAPFG